MGAAADELQPAVGCVGHLNRVMDAQASQVLGKITANGQVVLIQRTAVLRQRIQREWAYSGQYLTITNTDFMAGKGQLPTTAAPAVLSMKASCAPRLGLSPCWRRRLRNEGVIVAGWAPSRWPRASASHCSSTATTASPASSSSLPDQAHGRVPGRRGGWWRHHLSARAVDRQGGIVPNGD